MNSPALDKRAPIRDEPASDAELNEMRGAVTVWPNQERGIEKAKIVRIIARLDVAEAESELRFKRMGFEAAGHAKVRVALDDMTAHRDRLAEAVKELVEGLVEAREFILAEYGLPTTEAHHDGHPVAKEARPIWDKILALLITHS